MIDVFFHKIIPTDIQTESLFKLLNQRKHFISHKKKPSFAEHQEFVRSNPYRVWYILERNSKPIGTIYISKENTIGINFSVSTDYKFIEEVLNYVKANYSPLPAIKSIRGGAFSINVSPKNKTLITALEILKSKVVQISYSI
tara:strand:- start:777 stop:1202 length:426 start_codon:yes stop_codon:yes gene_type:complete